MDTVCGLKGSEIDRLISLSEKIFISARTQDWEDEREGLAKERYQEISSNKTLEFIQYVGNKMYDTGCITPFPDEPYKVAEEIINGIRQKDSRLVINGISALLLGLFSKLTRKLTGEHVR